MYSVLRVTIDAPRLGRLLAIGEAMNELEPGRFDGPRSANDGFACELAKSERWSDHLEAIAHVLRVQAQPLRDAVALGANVEVDVAIDGDDLARTKVFLSLATPPGLLAELGAAKVALEFTVYRP